MANLKNDENVRIEYLHSRYKFINSILNNKMDPKTPSKNFININCGLNEVLNKYENYIDCASNTYYKDNKYNCYLSKIESRGFDSPEKAKLFDVLYRFFDNRVSSNNINFIVDMLSSYLNNLEK